MTTEKLEIERPSLASGTGLVGAYVRWTLAYLAGVLLVWVLGFEAIFYHPTPFYALFRPAFAGPLAPLAAGALIAGSYLLLRAVYRPLLGPSLAAPWFAWALFAVFTGGALMVLAGQPETAAAVYGLRWHAFVAVVFVAFAGWFLAAWPLLDWFEGGPSDRATRWLLAGLVIVAFLFPASVAMIRGGTEGIAQAYYRYDAEYIGDIGMGRTIRGLFANYAEMHGHLSMHSKVHPPGPIVILWLLSYVVMSREALPLALATMAVGALAVLPLYGFGRDLFGRRVALTACLLYCLVPTVVLFTATSADILFMPLTITTLFLFWRAIHQRSIAYALTAGIMYAVLSLTSFSLISLGAFFGFVGLWRLADARYRVSVVQTAALMLTAFLAFHGAVWWWSGFNVIEVFMISKAQFDLDQYHLDQYTPRYPGWLFNLINPICWFFFAGIPVSLLFLRRLVQPGSATWPLMAVIGLTLVSLNVLYLARGEGERSAMYIIPFLVLPAAHYLDELVRKAESPAPLVATLGFLAFQCWFIEAYFYTYW